MKNILAYIVSLRWIRFIRLNLFTFFNLRRHISTLQATFLWIYYIAWFKYLIGWFYSWIYYNRLKFFMMNFIIINPLILKLSCIYIILINTFIFRLDINRIIFNLLFLLRRRYLSGWQISLLLIFFFRFNRWTYNIIFSLIRLLLNILKFIYNILIRIYSSICPHLWIVRPIINIGLHT